MSGGDAGCCGVDVGGCGAGIGGDGDDVLEVVGGQEIFWRVVVVKGDFVEVELCVVVLEHYCVCFVS